MGAGQGLVEVVVGVDEPGQDHVAGGVEHLIDDGGHPPAVGADVTLGDDAIGVRERGTVEGLGGRGTPIGEDRVAVLVGEPDAADPEATLIGVEAGEAQPVLDGIKRGLPTRLQVHHRLTQAPSLMGAARLAVLRLGQSSRRQVAGRIEAFVRHVEVFLLLGDDALFGVHAGLPGPVPRWAMALYPRRRAAQHRCRNGAQPSTANTRDHE